MPSALPDRRAQLLPQSLPPRGLSRTESAAYIGVGVTLFDRLIETGMMPRPKRLAGRVVWDRRQLDVAFDALPGGAPDATEQDVWDRVEV